MITRYAVSAAIAMCCAFGAAPTSALKATKASGDARGVKQPSATLSTNLFEEILNPAPAPVPDDVREHGPFAEIAATPVKAGSEALTQIEFNFQCDFSAEDENGGNWDWTYEAKLYDPSNNLIKQATNWVSGKPGYNSSIAQNIIDPAEGTYTCKVDWWVQFFYLGQGQSTKTISYMCPGDLEKTKIRKEYSDFSVVENRRPSCDNLRTDYSSTHFSSAELNRNGYHDLFWIQSALTTGLDAVRSDYGSAITTSNAYRCPEKNRDAGSQFLTTSWHLAGRAADLVPVSPDTLTPQWRTTIKNYAIDHGAQAVDEGDTVHVEWEG